MPTISSERDVRDSGRPRPLPTRSHSGRSRHVAHTLCRRSRTAHQSPYPARRHRSRSTLSAGVGYALRPTGSQAAPARTRGRRPGRPWPGRAVTPPPARPGPLHPRHHPRLASPPRAAAPATAVSATAPAGAGRSADELAAAQVGPRRPPYRAGLVRAAHRPAPDRRPAPAAAGVPALRRRPRLAAARGADRAGRHLARGAGQRAAGRARHRLPAALRHDHRRQHRQQLQDRAGLVPDGHERRPHHPQLR